jgi:hypothetical protein
VLLCGRIRGKFLDRERRRTLSTGWLEVPDQTDLFLDKVRAPFECPGLRSTLEREEMR